MTIEMLPKGFLASGRNAGIKNSKPDLGILISEAPATLAACVTTNRSRAACADRTVRLVEAGRKVRAIIAVSGNANALTGEAGIHADESIAVALGERIGVDADQIVTAATGVIGQLLPRDTIVGAIDPTLAALSSDPSLFAQSILTTDRVTKLSAREVFVSGKRVRLHAVAKGAGMIHPGMATMLCFVTTDARVDEATLKKALARSVEDTFNQLTVDNDMSTNDMVIALANGNAKGVEIPRDGPNYEIFADALCQLLDEMAKLIALDGEGANRLLDVQVVGAATRSDARIVSRAIASSMLVKTAIFGADPNAGGRMMSAAGAAAATHQLSFDPKTAVLEIQDIAVFRGGTPAKTDQAYLRQRMTEPEVKVSLDLKAGSENARAYGCDLSYDYVKINADYAAVTVTSSDGSVSVQDRLADLGPTIKKSLLIEALRYIDRFRGLRAVIKLGGAAMVDPKLELEFAEDVLLLRSVGLLPIVVHGGGAEISRTLEHLGEKTEFIDGLRVTNATSMRVVEMVLTGSVNQRLVAALNRTGCRAVGLSGKDGGLIRAQKIDRDLGQVGEVRSVDVTLINMLEKDGYIPVVSPVGLGDDSTSYNINADVVASRLATALGAEKLIFMSDVPGLLEADKVVSELNSDQLKTRLDRGEIKGGMKPKLESGLAALAGGVASVHVVDGRVPHNLIAELFTDSGVGTLIRRA